MNCMWHAAVKENAQSDAQLELCICRVALYGLDVMIMMAVFPHLLDFEDCLWHCGAFGGGDNLNGPMKPACPVSDVTASSSALAVSVSITRSSEQHLHKKIKLNTQRHVMSHTRTIHKLTFVEISKNVLNSVHTFYNLHCM